MLAILLATWYFNWLISEWMISMSNASTSVIHVYLLYFILCFQIPLHPVIDSLVNDVINLAFKHFKYKEG